MGKKKKEKEKIVIDVYYDEVGESFYRVFLYEDSDSAIEQEIGSIGHMPNCCQSGWFVNDYDLDEWLEENKDDIIITEDYR